MKAKLIVIFSAILLNLNLQAQEIDETHRMQMEEFIRSITSLEIEDLSTGDVKKVFNWHFYKMIPVQTIENGSSTCGEFRIVISEGVLSMLEEANEKKSMDRLFSLVREDFRLQSEADAAVFERALDVLYPLGWGDDPKYKKHYKQGNTWMFIRGEFFDSLSAFMVEVDGDSKPVSINFDLQAVEK